MKRQVQKTGVRKYFGADLVELQSEPLAALDALFAEYGPCIVQGCEITDGSDGTFDVAPGLVALAGSDPEGVQRVMLMPFAGASGVTLPLYLSAQAQIVERAYGDGKVKPIAYAYTAQAVGVDPGAGVPHLTLTAAGGNRFVDAVQDTAHRFITDAERSKWNRILEQAKEYADDVAATGSAAALRSAKEYTDTRETAILAAADGKDAATLRTAKDYADRIVAALVDNSPEALNTLQELAAALGGDPNFATTVFQLIGERATMTEVNAALAGKFGILGNDIDANEITQGSGYSYSKNTPAHGTVASFSGLGNLAYGTMQIACDNQTSNNARFWLRNNNQQGFTPWRELWHSGNFDPSVKMSIGDCLDDLNNISISGVYRVFSEVTNTPDTKFGSTVLHMGWDVNSAHQMYYTYNSTDVYIRHKIAGRWEPWSRIWNSGNLGPATASADGLMSAADKQKIDALSSKIFAGSVYSGGNARKGNWFSAAVIGDYIRVTHNLGHTNYIVTATAFAEGNSNYRDNTVTTMAQTASYFELCVSKGTENVAERCTVDFMLVCI